MQAETDTSAERHAAEIGQALSAVRAQRRTIDRLADALTICIVRLEDLNEGDGPTAQHARATLRSIGR